MSACLSKGIKYVAEKIRVEDHIMKMHLSLDEVPFYCSLCMFKCRSSTTLDNYLTRYIRHTLVAEEKVDAADHSCFRPNHYPYQIESKDTYKQKLDRDDSIFYSGSRLISQSCCLRDEAVKKSQISEVETGPTSVVNAPNKEQLFDLFQDFMRKMNTARHAPVPLSAREESLPAPCTLAGFRWTNSVYSRIFGSGSGTQSHFLFNRTSRVARRHHYM